MKRARNLVIGGIQNKIFNLILITIILISVANSIVFIYQNNVLKQVVAESSERQQKSIEDTTSAVMDEVVNQSLKRSNQMEVVNINDMFGEVEERVTFLADYATKMYAHPEDFSPQPYAGPQDQPEGEWTASVIYADDVNSASSEIISKTGHLANLSEVMISLCPSFGAEHMYAALPEGVFLSVSRDPGNWVENGQTTHYDPRQREWYQKAEQEKKLIFTEGEYDAKTNEYCIECAMPVYDPDGTLMAVIGADLYLDEIQSVLVNSSIEGESSLLVNGEGKAVLPVQEQSFPMAKSSISQDLRNSETELLAHVVKYTLEGKQIGILQGELSDGEYYITANFIETTGWILVSAYSKEIANQPVNLLKTQNQEIQKESEAVYQDKIRHANINALILLVIIAVCLIFAGVILGKRIVKPLNTITKRISQLREGNLEFKMEDAYRTGDEVQELAESFASLSHKTVQYVDTVKRVTAEKERIGTELALATRIQADMLPNLFPAFPERSEFDIYASMTPAKEVGGDFYDFFLIDDDHLCMVIADVSGKGVPAALFMMASKIILANNAMLGKSPAKILEDTNAAICANNREEMFVTVWLGILTLSTGKLVCANAGHEYPAFTGAEGRFELYKDKHGFVIGGMDGMKYTNYELTLQPGDKLFIYTDGIPEATNDDNHQFGLERMLQTLNEDPNASPEQILAGIHRAVSVFIEDAEQFDDLTMLALEYKGN